METETLSDQLVNSKFGLAFIKVLAPLTGKHLKIFLENKGTDYDEIGDAKEKQLKGIAHIYGLLQTTVSDLELVLTFLRVEDRKSITQVFPALESQEQYFKYHLENFIIRIITLTDIVGKLGNAIFETGLPEEKCNGYTFKEKIKQSDPNCSALIEKLLVETKEIKDRRHVKLHTGESKIGYFEGIVFWDELSKIIKSEASPLLDELTDTNIKNEINTLEKEIRNIISLVVDFTDYATDKFNEIASR